MKAILALLSLLAIASCAGPDLRVRPKLVGDWRYFDEAQSCRYSFKADGSFSGEVARGNKVVLKFGGRWAVDGDVLLYVYQRERFGRIPPGTRDQDRLLELTRDSFLIQAANGDRRRYHRIR